MKKFIFTFLAAFSITAVSQAQLNYLPYFPKENGTVLVTSAYGPGNNLLATMTLDVVKYYQEQNMAQVEVGFKINSATGTGLEQGLLEVSQDQDNVNFKMKENSRADITDRPLSLDAVLLANFLAFPGNQDVLYPDDLGRMTSGVMAVEFNDSRGGYRIELTNQEMVFQENPAIATPAGAFDTSKVQFRLEKTEAGETTEYNGVLWYSEDRGVVRAEVYDDNKNLLDYAVLTSATVTNQ